MSGNIEIITPLIYTMYGRKKHFRSNHDLGDIFFWKQSLEAGTKSDTLHLFGHGNFIFIGEF